MSSERIISDFEVLVKFTSAAITGLITIDPNGEWSAEELAANAVDIALETQLELKRRKSGGLKKANVGNGAISVGRSSSVQGRGSSGDH